MQLYLFDDNNIASVFGIGTYIRELVATLESSGIHIHIVHLHSNRPRFEIEKTDQVENWYIPKVYNDGISFNSVQNIEDYCRNVLYLLRLHIPEDTENLIFHFNYNQYQWLAKELKTAFNCTTVTTVHFVKWMLELQGNLSMFHAIKAKPENQLNSLEQSLLKTDEYESMLYREVDKVIALSRDMKNHLCNEYQIIADKIIVIPNGLSKIDNVETDNYLSLRKKWHINDKELLILFVGRLHPVKGLAFLIRAFREVLKTMPNCRLIIAGNGNYDLYLKECKDICTKITFAGFLEKHELHELYHIADLGITPSLYEPFGYVALEMMMHSLPIVTTTTSGLNEVVNDTCGLKIPLIVHSDRVDIDVDLLAEKIRYLLQCPVEAHRLGKNGRKRLMKYYSPEIFRQNMMDLYKSLIQRNMN